MDEFLNTIISTATIKDSGTTKVRTRCLEIFIQPEQSIHIRQPRFKDNQSGSFLLHSTQLVLLRKISAIIPAISLRRFVAAFTAATVALTVETELEADLPREVP